MIEQGAMVRITWISLIAIPLMLVLILVMAEFRIPDLIALPVIAAVLIIPRYLAIKRFATLVDYTRRPVI